MRRLGGVLVVLLVCALGAPPAHAATQRVVGHSETFRLGGFRTIQPKVGVTPPRRDGYVTRMDARLVDVRGRPVPLGRVMLHHLVFLREGGTTTCPGRKGQPFWGTGEERQRLVLPAGHGLRVRGHHRWRMQVMLMSHSLKAMRVRVQYRYTFVTGRRMVPVRPLWLRASGCTSEPSYEVFGNLPPGAEHVQRHDWRVPESGRIVAAGAHLHGSSHGMTISQPRCGDRTLVDHKPRYGGPQDPVYRVRPVLHEPGPVATGYFLSRDGISVRKGDLLRVTGVYEGSRPHVAVMAITHVYLAPARAPRRRCAALPADRRTLWTRKGTSTPPVVRQPIYGLTPGGRVREIERPPGPERVVTGDSTVRVGAQFAPRRLSVPRGARVTWAFDRSEPHTVMLTSGPRLVTSGLTPPGGRYGRTFTEPGTYKLFCNLHPVTMTQVVTVRPSRR